MMRSTLRGGRVVLVVMAAAALLALLALLVLRPSPQAGVPAGGVTAAPPPAASPARASDGADADVGIPHTRLPLRLLATVVRGTGRLSLATVEQIEAGGHQVLGEGQPFRGHPRVRVASIERGRVLIDNDGVREQLVIDRDARPVTRDAPTAARAADAGTDSPGVGRAERAGLPAEGEVSPVYEEGELIGVQLDDLRAGGVYARMGLRNGDIVTAINGISLAEPTAAAEMLAELALSDVLEVDVEHADGTQELLSVPTAGFTAVPQLE
jgi:general secretion pathway protein C